MKILFVDDDLSILSGLERMLFVCAEDWDISCVGSGSEALSILEKEDDFQVVVTDMRMPRMDGAKLLRKVSEKYPHIIRIVLSGYAELEVVLRVVPVAHQFLTKPCSAEVLVETVTRACSLQNVLGNVELAKVVGSLQGLPSLPRVYTELTKVLALPSTKAKDVADVMLQDPTMCAKVLQLVNSSFFGCTSPVSDIRHAVVLLGFQMVKNLALSVEVFQAPSEKPCMDGFSIVALQQHALRSAAIARNLVPGRTQSDAAFMGAMLHELGTLVLASKLPDRWKSAHKMAKAEQIPLFVAEEKVFGISHAEIGAHLLALWGLPYPIIEAVVNHHHPERSSSTSFGVQEAVYVANHLAEGTAIDPEYLKRFAVSNKLDGWREMAEKIREQ